ncbi:MAG: hypothetical protein Q7S13_06475 [Candidatus Omnitrophota bacterium]|nr:hypothetical protein [Candidatus Omnitrophota bacterium]
MIRLKSALSVLFSSIVFFCTPINLWACQPSHGDAWFNKQVEFVKEAMPQGIELVDNYFDIGQGLTNKSNEPFYLVRPLRDGESAARHTSSEVPSNTEPLYKLVDGQVYFWSNRGEWKINSGGDHDYAAFMVSMKDIIDTHVFEQMFSTTKYIVTGPDSTFFKDTHGDNRPDGAAVPSVQEVELVGYIHDQQVPLKVRIFYSWNEAYDPHLAEKENAACQQ